MLSVLAVLGNVTLHETLLWHEVNVHYNRSCTTAMYFKRDTSTRSSIQQHEQAAANGVDGET